MNENINYSMSFDEYLDREYAKFVAIITKRQYAMETTDNLSHDDLSRNLIEKINSNVNDKFDWEYDGTLESANKYNAPNIIIAGYPDLAIVELPKVDMLSPEQYDCLKDILISINERNKKNTKKIQLLVYGNNDIKIETKYYEDSIEELLSELKKYIKEPTNIENENIIGKSIIPLEKVSEDATRDILSRELTTNILAGESTVTDSEINWDNFDLDNFDWNEIDKADEEDKKL